MNTHHFVLCKTYKPKSQAITYICVAGMCQLLEFNTPIVVNISPRELVLLRNLHRDFVALGLLSVGLHRWLHCKKFASVLLKVDIAKAFDCVVWPFLMEVLQHIGFPHRWTNGISILLSTASTKVLLNGRAGRIIHARGLRQGIPFHRCYLSSSWRHSTRSSGKLIVVQF